MNEIEMKIKEKTKPLCDICDKLTKSIDSHIENGIDNVDAMEMGAVIDMVKDLAEAKEKTIKAMYYEQIMVAMDKSEYGEDYDQDGPRYYRGRDSMGRYTHRPYSENRDMDRSSGKMYYGGRMPDYRGYDEGYDEGMRHGYEEAQRDGMMNGSRYDGARRGFEEAKNRGDREKAIKSLDDMLQTIGGDLAGLVPQMDAQEKMATRNKLQAIQNKIS